MTLVHSSAHTVPSTHVQTPSFAWPPTIIFTVLGSLRANGTQMNAYAARVIQALAGMQLPDALVDMKRVVFSSQEEMAQRLQHGDLDLTGAIALFDEVRREGCYSFRYTPRFPKQYRSLPRWVERSRWAVVIHRNDPDRIARQLTDLLTQHTIHDLFRRTSFTKKRNKKRKRRLNERRSDQRSVYFSY